MKLSYLPYGMNASVEKLKPRGLTEPWCYLKGWKFWIGM